MTAFLPPPARRGIPIVVVSQDLSPGHVLTRGDLGVADWPADLSPDGAAADPVSLVGKALGAGMSRGEPVTAARVRGPGLLAGVGTGLVAAHVRLADPAMAAMATAGDKVDLISSACRLVAADVTVLAVDASPAGSGGWSPTPESGRPGGVIVAVARDAALRLATVDPAGLADSAFSLVMKTPGISPIS
jgi:Flp pilus assembly protein CpaB